MILVEHLTARGVIAWGWFRQSAARALFALLLAYHAGLLATHVVDGRLLEPATSARWLVGGFLLAGFLALRRLGVPLIRGRKAVVLWLLVFLLHGHAALSPLSPGNEEALPASVAGLTTEVIGALVVFLGFGLIALLRRAAPGAVRAAWRRFVDGAAHRTSDGGYFLVCAARPPPCGWLPHQQI
jgi:hypothetical protein